MKKYTPEWVEERIEEFYNDFLREMGWRFVKFYAVVDHSKCTLCCACLKGCPHKAISIRKKKIFINRKKCRFCYCCQEFCPNKAIKVRGNLLARTLWKNTR